VILTTHTGSLPRPKDLLRLLQEREEGRLTDAASLAGRTRSAVLDVVRKQREARHPDLKDAAAAAGADEVFMTSPSPGQIGRFLALASRALW
jgi:hypothetical protein